MLRHTVAHSIYVLMPLDTATDTHYSKSSPLFWLMPIMIIVIIVRVMASLRSPSPPWTWPRIFQTGVCQVELDHRPCRLEVFL